jgi:uncharacterized protein
MVGPDWLTGGIFGAQASVVALVVCAAAGIILITAAVRKGRVLAAFWVGRLGQSDVAPIKPMV